MARVTSYKVWTQLFREAPLPLFWENPAEDSSAPSQGTETQPSASGETAGQPAGEGEAPAPDASGAGEGGLAA